MPCVYIQLIFHSSLVILRFDYWLSISFFASMSVFFLSNNLNVFSWEKRQQSSSPHHPARWGVCRACKLLRAWAWREAIKSVFSLCHILPDLPHFVQTHQTYKQTHQNTQPQTHQNTKPQTNQKGVLFVPHPAWPPTTSYRHIKRTHKHIKTQNHKHIKTLPSYKLTFDTQTHYTFNHKQWIKKYKIKNMFSLCYIRYVQTSFFVFCVILVIFYLYLPRLSLPPARRYVKSWQHLNMLWKESIKHFLKGK